MSKLRFDRFGYASIYNFWVKELTDGRIIVLTGDHPHNPDGNNDTVGVFPGKNIEKTLKELRIAALEKELQELKK